MRRLAVLCALALLAGCSGRDAALSTVILSIRDEELAHLRHAEDRITSPGAGSRLLHRLITFATDAVIWLSTWGDSMRMARALRAM